MTDGGLEVAFFWPMDQNPYFFPIRSIHVASMSLRDHLGPHGLDALASECVWVWVPCSYTPVVVRSRKTPVSS